MIDRQRLLDDLKPLLKQMEADLRARCDEVAEINAGLQSEYQQARAADRTGAAFEEWRADLITQVAVAWVLSCVFVRFLEDNGLISPPRISGPLHGAGDGQGMLRARDERDLYFKSHPTGTDRDYLLAVFDDMAKLPGTKDVFGPHNPVSAYRNWLSGDAAQKLIEFFQKIDTDGTGEIIHDFTDTITPKGGWDTRFLGDLYQDLSEAARKKYALLQTPVFVEEFILERTLEPAINEFGLKDFKMIDPACGSGHFLLGSFARILAHWRKQEPGTPDRELVNRAIAAVYGVDLNPYAVAIARFRLLVAAMRECRITRLKDAPAFAFNLVCGDSLLHGSPGTEQQLLGFHELAHAYQSEDLLELKRILKPGSYHAVVANPPYITSKDKALNQAYRERYPEVCHRQYSVAVPFLQRLFVLAGAGGYTGQITANSFMKREFGKKLIESYLPKIDLTHVIDSSGAYIPGHGTPTVILFGRNRPPVVPTVRAVMGIKGEPATPEDPSQGLVWTAITRQIDQVGSQSGFVSVTDTSRDQFSKHPWSIGGGGAAELKETLDESAVARLASVIDDLGRSTHTGEDDAFYTTPSSAKTKGFTPECVPLVIGEDIRDYTISPNTVSIFPYDKVNGECADISLILSNHFWSFRTALRQRLDFGNTPEQRGLRWFDHSMFFPTRYSRPFSIAFAFVATHNHFVLDRGGKVFKQSAPVIKLSADATEDDHLALLGLLNSSTACFWMKQIFHNKGSTVDQAGARQRTAPFEDFWEHDGTKLKQFPLAAEHPLCLAQRLDKLARNQAEIGPAEAIRLFMDEDSGIPDSVAISRMDSTMTFGDALAEARETSSLLRARMIAVQEELDWECYGLYGLLDDSPGSQDPPPLKLGQRAFEIVLARRMAAGEEETSWFVRHGSTPVTDIPAEWPEEYKRVVQRRIEIIESDPNIALIERPEYKRRWNTEPWAEQQERALRNWLLDRLENYFDLDGRMSDDNRITSHASLREPRLTSVAQIADIARADKEFMQVAELYAGRMDFDVANLVGELVTVESVPVLPVLRYKLSGMDKRTAWERTWELQRLEDELARRREVAHRAIKSAEEAACAPIAKDISVELNLWNEVRTAEEAFRKQHYGDQRRELSLSLEDDYNLNAPAPTQEGRRTAIMLGQLRQRAKHTSMDLDSQRKRLIAESKAVKDANTMLASIPADPDIPVPPKYTSVDFQSSEYWRLRGKLDVPKERWVSFPHCEGEDGTLVIAWAGYNHLQLARAIAERYELAKEQEGRKLVPLLAAIGQLIPWLKQWHNDLDPTFGTRMGDYFEGYLAEEAKAMGKSVDEVMAWTPPPKTKAQRRKKKLEA